MIPKPPIPIDVTTSQDDNKLLQRPEQWRKPQRRLGLTGKPRGNGMICRTVCLINRVCICPSDDRSLCVHLVAPPLPPNRRHSTRRVK